MKNPTVIAGLFVSLLLPNFKDMSEVTEIWKDIPGYGGYYQISNSGLVKSLARKGSPRTLILRHNHNPQGYPIAAIQYKGVLKTLTLHRFVAHAFVENHLNLNEVNHLDGNKRNNNAENLAWCTRSENVQHAFDNGFKFGDKGEKHGMALLTEKLVLEIRAKYKPRVYTVKMLATEYGVSYSTIQKVVLNVNWSHI